MSVAVGVFVREPGRSIDGWERDDRGEERRTRAELFGVGELQRSYSRKEYPAVDLTGGTTAPVPCEAWEGQSASRELNTLVGR